MNKKVFCAQILGMSLFFSFSALSMKKKSKTQLVRLKRIFQDPDAHLKSAIKSINELKYGLYSQDEIANLKTKTVKHLLQAKFIGRLEFRCPENLYLTHNRDPQNEKEQKEWDLSRKRYELWADEFKSRLALLKVLFEECDYSKKVRIVFSNRLSTFISSRPKGPNSYFWIQDPCLIKKKKAEDFIERTRRNLNE